MINQTGQTDIDQRDFALSIIRSLIVQRIKQRTPWEFAALTIGRNQSSPAP
jgi:hypothetical protein